LSPKEWLFAAMKETTEAIREASHSDVPQIVSLINRAFAITRSFRQGNRSNPEQIETMMGAGKFLLLGSEADPVACVYLRLTGERAYLGTLSVDPAKQKRGIGTRMMRYAEDYCRSAGCKAIDIRIVNLRTELPEIYRKFGFVETGTQPAEVIKDATQPIHFITMSKQL
jgi:N-acetylglutamate synthase-like GNAT family acetyltransferase